MRSTQNSIFVDDFDQSSPKINNVRRLTLDNQTNYHMHGLRTVEQ